MEIIILSGFAEFNYAKEAISIGVAHYLTKPISSAELIAHIDELSGKIEEKKQERLLLEKYASDMAENMAEDKKKLFMLGTPAFREEMVSYGFTDVGLDEEPEAVITAFDTGLVYERLCKSAWWIKHGNLWIATHPDLECPTELETTLVDCGSVTACLECVSKRKAIVLGKPNKEMITLIMDRHGLRNEEVVMCGDRPYTDIQLAVNSGTFSAMIAPAPPVHMMIISAMYMLM